MNTFISLFVAVASLAPNAAGTYGALQHLERAGAPHVSPIQRATYAATIALTAEKNNISARWITAIIHLESRWRPNAIRPGCERNGQRGCNQDGIPDVGLCQLRVGVSWQPLSMSEALDPLRNIRQCGAHLAEQRRHHRARGCARSVHARRWERWPWSRPENHRWIQHHNMGSSRYEQRALATHERIGRHYRRTKRLWAPIIRWIKRMEA